MPAKATVSGRVEIDFSVYNPFAMSFIENPFPVLEHMLNEFPVAFHKDINAWFVSSHELAAEVLRPPVSRPGRGEWRPPPPLPPADKWTLWDRLQEISMINVGPEQHMRLRRLTAPAFSRRVMDQIEASVREAVVEIFDEIEDPRQFTVAAGFSVKVPIRAIARMVGVPPEARELFEHGLGWNLVRVTNPMYAADRDTYVNGTLPGLQYLLDTISARRQAGDPGDYFIGTLEATEIDGVRLSDLEILSVISALVTAGADTAVDLHTLAIQALLKHPDQRALLRQCPELMEGAILEILRCSARGKFGAIPRYPLQDTELGGQVLEKGSFVMPFFSAAALDPAKWPDPTRSSRMWSPSALQPACAW